MPKRVQITTPWPTPEEEARRLGISKRRQKEINAMAEEIVKRIRSERRVSSGKSVDQGKKRRNGSAAA